MIKRLHLLFELFKQIPSALVRSDFSSEWSEIMHADAHYLHNAEMLQNFQVIYRGSSLTET